MAISDEDSTQVANINATPPVMNETTELHGRVRIAYFDHTQAVAGDANSIVSLAKLPPGKIRVLGDLSRIDFSAFGAARTLDVGYAAYTDDNGDAVVADPNAFASAVDVSAAGNLNLGEAIAAGTGKTTEFASQSGVTVQCDVAADTIPAAATLNGYILYVQD